MNLLTCSLDHKSKQSFKLNSPLKPFNNKCLKVMPYPVFPLFVATMVFDIQLIKCAHSILLGCTIPLRMSFLKVERRMGNLDESFNPRSELFKNEKNQNVYAVFKKHFSPHFGYGMLVIYMMLQTGQQKYHNYKICPMPTRDL